MKLSRKIPVFTLLFSAVMSVAPLAVADADGYTSYDDSYHASQLLDGFGALLIAPAEPILLPVAHTKECSAEGRSGLESTGCGFVGFLISPLYLVRDVFAGVGDIATFGYFRFSRNAGVFDHFQ